VNGNTGHGHVFPRADGIKARCGGPAICRECAHDLARKLAKPRIRVKAGSRPIPKEAA